jgi:RNA polymerase sigma factor (sigma-70 family)
MPPFEANDLAATFVTDILLKVSQYNTMEGGGFQAWVYQSMRNMAADWGRKRRRTLPTVASDRDSSEWADPGSGGAAESALDPEEIAAVREAWEQLSDTDREILEIRDLRYKPKWSEIADELGIGEGAARVRHTRAMQRLAEILQADPRIQREISIEVR